MAVTNMCIAVGSTKPTRFLVDEGGGSHTEKRCRQVLYVAGGATQNSIRVAQWMLQETLSGAWRELGFEKPHEISKQAT